MFISLKTLLSLWTKKKKNHQVVTQIHIPKYNILNLASKWEKSIVGRQIQH